jgi:hypothetical protein
MREVNRLFIFFLHNFDKFFKLIVSAINILIMFFLYNLGYIKMKSERWLFAESLRIRIKASLPVKNLPPGLERIYSRHISDNSEIIAFFT